MTTPLTPKAINKLRKYMEPRTISEIYNILEDLIKENKLRKQDTSTHFAAYMKVCDQLKIAKEALEYPCPYCSEVLARAERQGLFIIDVCSKCYKCNVALSKLTI